jgi:hypothetical protein
MATLFLLAAAHGPVEALDCSDTPLFLDGHAAASTQAAWQVAVVPFATDARASRRYALLAAPGVDVIVDGRVLSAGVTELRDREHFLVGECEAVLSTDAVPEPLPAAGAPCPVCCETPSDDTLFRCARCGLSACRRCWSLAPRAVCLTPGCNQPAALVRTLWAPARSDFVSGEDPS